MPVHFSSSDPAYPGIRGNNKLHQLCLVICIGNGIGKNIVVIQTGPIGRGHCHAGRCLGHIPELHRPGRNCGTGQGNAYLGAIADRILLRGYCYPGRGFYPNIGCIIDAGAFFQFLILPRGYKV